MKSWEENPFHTFLVLTEKPGEWAPWKIAPLPLVAAASAGLAWALVGGDLFWGWAVALGLLAFALADWGLLAFLPRLGISFGAVQPPFLGLTLLRWAITLVAVIAVPVAQGWPLPALVAVALVQVVIWAAAVYGTMVEPFRVQTTLVEVPTAKLPRLESTLAITQISDLHVERLTRRERALPALVTRVMPDLILLTGDFLSTSYNEDPQALADLRTLLAQLYAPSGIYAIWGTTDVDRPEFLRPTLDELGIVVLEDQAVEVRIGGDRLWLVGMTCTRNLDRDGARLASLLADVPAGAMTLLLYHTPDLMPQAAAHGVDLYLTGHTHGGQWRLPGFGALVTSSYYWKRYEAGLYQEGDTLLYVSRGLGMEGFGAPRARFFCRPELVSITLVGTGQAEEPA